jgi:hypothetical protein
MVFRKGSFADKVSRKLVENVQKKIVDDLKKQGEDFAADLGRKGARTLYSALSRKLNS